MHPHDEDGEEAGNEGEVTGPELEQSFPEGGRSRAGWWNCGDFQFEDQKSDGDSEDAVAEGFEAAGFFFALGFGLRLHREMAQNWVTEYQ